LQAISRHPSLRRWILLRYKKICDSCDPAVVSEVSSCLKVLGSLSLAEDKCHMDTESSVLEKLDKSIRENMQSDELISSSEQEVLSKNDSINTYVEKSSQSNNVVVHADDKTSQKQTDAKILSSKGANVVSDAAHKDTRPDLAAPKSTYDSAGGSTTLISPGLHFGKAKHLSSELFDIYGVSGSRDVISVSKELWVGSLGNRASEALVRSKFEEFGPLGNFLFHSSKDFALVEYRNIIHAVRACRNMQGSSIWGGFLQIKYLDRLIGSKGFIGGMAIDDSRHIYVAKIRNQKDKDEVFDQLKAAGVKRPCGFTDISSENALLLEFETAVDATTAKLHIRCHAHADIRSKDNRPGHQLLVQNIDNSVPDVEVINAFTRYGEVVRWQFNRTNGNCLIIYRSYDAAAYAKSQLHGARFGMKSITVESKTCTAGFFHDQTSSVAPILGQSAPGNSIHHDIRQAFLSTPTINLWMQYRLHTLLFHDLAVV
jgi:activating signal cointegrator complex subunit 2